jgi:hypothetical protein
MSELPGFACCRNSNCQDFKKIGTGNISYRGWYYGKDHDRRLLYCKTGGRRFAATQGSPLLGVHLPVEKVHQIFHHAAEGVGVRATARLLGLTKNTVNSDIVKVGEHCQSVYRSLMRDLKMNEVQLDELWTFVKKNDY